MRRFTPATAAEALVAAADEDNAEECATRALCAANLARAASSSSTVVPRGGACPRARAYSTELEAAADVVRRSIVPELALAPAPAPLPLPPARAAKGADDAVTSSCAERSTTKALLERDWGSSGWPSAALAPALAPGAAACDCVASMLFFMVSGSVSFSVGAEPLKLNAMRRCAGLAAAPETADAAAFGAADEDVDCLASRSTCLA